jgi:dipeptidyl aminopeptidase/acylaminoacyl peptidase
MPAVLVRHRFILAAVLVAVLALNACGGSEGGGPGNTSDGRLLITRDAGIVQRPVASESEELLIPRPPETILAEPAVSPSGDRIAYVQQLTPFVEPGETADFGTDLFLANIDGSDPQLLTEHAFRGEFIMSPVWVNDDRIIIASQRYEGANLIANLELVDVATGGRTVFLEGATQPTVSPDGSQLAFVRVAADFTQSLWLSRVSGAEAREIAGRDADFVSFQSPRFSPDGTKIAAGAATPLDPNAGASAPRLAAPHNATLLNGLPMDVYLFEVPDGEATLLANMDLDQPSLSWSGGGETLYVLAASGLYSIGESDGADERIGEGTFHGQLTWAE